jgi:PBSX family phage terminase large subunit
MPAGRVSRAGRHASSQLRKWQPTIKQRDAAKLLHDPNVANILLSGGARAGKTEAIVRFMATRAEQYPGSKQIMLRKVRRSAQYSLWESVVKHYRRYVPRDRYRLYQDDMVVIHANDSILQVDGLDDSNRLENILGTEFITIFVNEATQIGYGFISLLRSRLAQLCYHVSGNGWVAATKMICDCNPRHKRHWLYRMGIRNLQPDVLDQDIEITGAGRWSSMHFTPYDNLANLPPGYIETHLDTLPTKIRQRMRDGLWVSTEGLVYDNFDEDVNVLERFDITPEYHVLRGVDFGFCYSSDTEVLTEHGWQKHEDVKVPTKIATYDTTTNTIKYELPLGLWTQPYRGKMIHVKSRSSDFLVSPEQGQRTRIDGKKARQRIYQPVVRSTFA